MLLDRAVISSSVPEKTKEQGAKGAEYFPSKGHMMAVREEYFQAVNT